MINLKHFLIFLPILAAVQSKQIHLSCETSPNSQCSSGFCFHLRGEGLDVKYCLPEGQNCTVGDSSTVWTSLCLWDYKNHPCNAGVCYYTVDQPVCSKDYTQCSDTPDFYRTSCTACTVIGNCSKCLIGQKNGALNTAEICLGPTCKQIVDVNAAVKTCTNGVDAFGFKCQCCATMDRNVSACFSNNDALSLVNVTYWAKGIDNSSYLPNNTDNPNNPNNTNSPNSTNGSNIKTSFQPILHLAWIILLAILVI